MVEAVDPTPSRAEFFRFLLTPLWLRPESALWYSHMLYEAKRLLGRRLIQPSLDLGCMDGVNSFVLLGGRFGHGFDVYREVRWDRDAHRRSTLADDYFDVVADDPGEIDIHVRPTDYFEFGLDWKASHIDKARRLGVHRRLIQCDPASPFGQIESASIATVWAPNIYWLDDVSRVASELRRILVKTGRIVTIVPDRIQLNHMLYRFAEQSSQFAWLKDLDRGRFENVSRQARDLSEWVALFDRAGLTVASHDGFIPSLVGEVYDVGLRPMFPVFMNMYETLRTHAPESLLELKREWLETVYRLAVPLCDVDWMPPLQMERLWHVFELTAHR